MGENNVGLKTLKGIKNVSQNAFAMISHRMHHLQESQTNKKSGEENSGKFRRGATAIWHMPTQFLENTLIN